MGQKRTKWLGRGVGNKFDYLWGVLAKNHAPTKVSELRAGRERDRAKYINRGGGVWGGFLGIQSHGCDPLRKGGLAKGKARHGKKKKEGGAQRKKSLLSLHVATAH